jgi:hypothetical protein
MMPSPSLTTENTKFTEEGTEKIVQECSRLSEIQIYGAIEMYRNNNFTCAITLAGAANTLSSGVIKENPALKDFNSLYISKQQLIEKGIKEEDIPDLSKRRNLQKHFGEHKKNDGQLISSLKDSFLAELEIRSAIFNHYVVTKTENERMEIFINSINSQDKNSLASVPSSVNSVSSVVKQKYKEQTK